MSADHTEALPSGYELLEYRLQKVIGEGGFGITYLAHDSTLDCLVAIKEYLPIETARRTASAYTVRPRSSNTEGDFNWGLEQFLEEARRLNRLNHPNIIRVRRFFKENGTAYLVMDYADGPTLETWLQQHGRLSYEDVAGLLRPLLDGLDHVHRNSYLHRDIKPDNIILRNATQLGVRSPVLIDFGAARQAIGARTHKLTTLVSAGYSPLEQYAANRPQTPAGDIYALAGVTYRCLSGLEPQPSPDRSLDDNLPGHLHQLVGQAPEAFLVAIEKGLSLKAVERYQSVTTFRESLFPGEPEVQAQPDLSISPIPLTAEATEAALEQQETGSNRSHRARSKGTVKYSPEQATDEPPTGPIRSGHQTKWKVWLANLASTALMSLPRWARLAIGGAKGSEAALVQPQESVSRNRAAFQFASLAVVFAFASSSIFPLWFLSIHGGLPDNESSAWSQAFLYFPLATLIAAFISHRLFQPPKTRFAVVTFMAKYLFTVLSYVFVTVWSTSLYQVFHKSIAPLSLEKLHEIIIGGLSRWGDMFQTSPFSFFLFFVLYSTLCLNHDKGLGIQPKTWAKLTRRPRVVLMVILTLLFVWFILAIIGEREAAQRADLDDKSKTELKRIGYVPSWEDYNLGETTQNLKLKEAIQTFQKKLDMPIDGEVSETFLERLRQEPTKTNWVVSKGGEGDVRNIQEALDAIIRVDNALRNIEAHKDTSMAYRISLKPGVYRENISVTCGEHNSITIEGVAGNEKAVIEGRDGKDEPVIWAGCRQTIIDNVTVVQKNNSNAVYFAGPNIYSINNSIIRSNKKDQWGVYVDGPKTETTESAKEKASLNMTNSEVWGGIGLTGRTDGKITGSNITAPAGNYALGFYGAATPMVDNNNTGSISIGDEAAPMLIGNRISASKHSAVQVMGDGLPTLRDNRIRATDGNCINIVDATGITTIENNILEQCGSYPAIAVSEKARAIIRNNQIVPDGAGEPYIYVKEGGEVTSVGNKALASGMGQQ